jgi:hypothetical protein
MSDRFYVTVGVVAATAFLVCHLLIVSHYPYRQGFDDFDHIPAAIQWSEHQSLSDDGLFLRVPFWPMLLGTVYHVFAPRVHAAILVLQAAIILATIGCCLVFVHKELGASMQMVCFFPILLFSISPQTLLYARHAVNEPFIGLLAVLIMLVGTAGYGKKPLLLGVLCGMAWMTKIISVLLALPALGYIGYRKGVKRALRDVLIFLLGMALIAVPLYALHFSQRGSVRMDTTSAFNLSSYTPQEWLALGDHAARYSAGIQDWRETFWASPTAYLEGFLGRLVHWVERPSSADFAHFYADYPHRLIQLWDQVVLLTLLILAVIGTRKRHALIWTFPIAIALGSTFPQHTPFSTKVILIYPAVLLAPLGLQRIREAMGKPPERPEEGPGKSP